MLLRVICGGLDSQMFHTVAVAQLVKNAVVYADAGVKVQLRQLSAGFNEDAEQVLSRPGSDELDNAFEAPSVAPFVAGPCQLQQKTA